MNDRCCFAFLLAFPFTAFTPFWSYGELIYQSSETIFEGSTGSSYSGLSANTDLYSGTRFYLPEKVRATAIGGHFTKSSFSANDQVFGVIVSLDNSESVPDLDNRVVAQTLITLGPSGRSMNISGSVDVVLNRGWYALTFGAGRFGAPDAWAIAVMWRGHHNFNSFINPVFTMQVSDGTFRTHNYPARYFMEGLKGEHIPEPTTLTLSTFALIPVAGRRRR